MRLRDRLVSAASRPHLPRRTVRLRFTVLYSVLFLVSGALLLTITYVLVRHTTDGSYVYQAPNGATIIANKSPNPSVPEGPTKDGTTQVSGGDGLPPPENLTPEQVEILATEQHDAELRQLLTQSAVALGVMTVLSIALGWIVAGRVLRPLRTMTATTRQISERNLHERLALPGPRDELKDLGDTIDGLLARMEGAFDAQKRFVANASHELRTPLTLGRTILQVALADPHLTLDSLRAACEEVLAADDQQEHLIEALLTLARSQRGLDHRESFDLADVARDALHAHERDALARGSTVTAALDPAPISGDAHLAARLVSNLVENALRHNVPHGNVTLNVGSRAGLPALQITNTGPVVPADQIDRLLQPFQRVATDRGTERDGHGLGLSIVTAIADAHGATVRAHTFAGGGLDIEVIFPAPRGGPARLDPLPSVRAEHTVRPAPSLSG